MEPTIVYEIDVHMRKVMLVSHVLHFRLTSDVRLNFDIPLEDNNGGLTVKAVSE
jgi:hypothetical protein